jgi:8-oxo-dGTP pyrophosphatase MutT (NUDIX family)
MSATYPVWDGRQWRDLPVAESGGEAVVVPNVAAVVYRGGDFSEILLQRRDKPMEAVRGRLEIPGGRWRAGELPDTALRREVEEETGIVLTAVGTAGVRIELEPHVAFSVAQPLAVVNGLQGAYPALHAVFECHGEGTPRPQPGETREPAWWPVERVVAHLEQEPHDFVWHTQVMLDLALRPNRG